MTSIQRFLNLELPVLQAPMAGAQGSALAVAVSNAGGLGALPGAMLDAAALRAELSAIQAGTQGPYNVNFFCHRPPAADAGREAVWRAVLAPFYRELGIDPGRIQPGPGRSPFTAEMADVLAEFEPPVVSFHFGLPAEELLRRVKAWGAKVLSSATTVEEARWLERHGADAIIAQGAEAGGHRGMFLSADASTQVGTFALVPQVVAAVSVPVVAAGGIADARGVAAALALGAAGVQIGTAFLLTAEAKTSPLHRAALKQAHDNSTTLTNVFTGRPARGIVNRYIREVGPMSPDAPQFPLAAGASQPMRAAGEAKGTADFTPLWSGQAPTFAREMPTADLIASFVKETEAVAKRFAAG